jgi:hypothetical protein
MKTILIIQLAIILIVCVCWVKTLILLSACDFEAPYKAELLHAAGIIPPVGAVTGWLDLGK